MVGLSDRIEKNVNKRFLIQTLKLKKKKKKSKVKLLHFSSQIAFLINSFVK